MQKKTLTCNASYNAASVLPDGSVNACFDRQDESLGNIFTGFKFKERLIECGKVHCRCPLWAFEKDLYKAAKGEPHRERPYYGYLHWHITYECQMLCNYCIVTGPDRKTDLEDKLRKSQPVDIDAVMRTLEATGHKYYISLMGGEPFLVPNILDLIKELTRNKHYVGANTNLTAVDSRLWTEVDHDYLANFHISLHAQPMERRKLTEEWIEKYHAMARSGFKNYQITAVAHPNLLARLDEYRRFYGAEGVQFKLIPMLEGGGASGGKPYPESYTPDELKLIETDWLQDYFPQKNAINEKPRIQEFRTRGKGKDDQFIPSS